MKPSSVFNLHTPLESVDMLNYGLKEKRDILISDIEAIKSERLDLYKLLGRPNKVNLKKRKGRDVLCKSKYSRTLQRYFECGAEIQDISTQIITINKKIAKKIQTTYPEMFVHIARQLLLEEDFQKVQKYAFYRFNAMQNGVRDN